ncbi:MAG: restriction endonuclease subunit S [Deltaproteobacteria bacterium]|nr:restriction endonuclease subunit S [Deltaproteobacteria bacterium]
MIANLKPYPEYKETVLPWIGHVPGHWGQLRAKYLFREVDDRSTTGREELLSVSHLTGVTPRSQKTVTMFLAKSNVGHKICRPGDALINTMWAWMGALGVARHDGIVSPSYGVYRPLDGCAILPSFADHLLRTPTYVAEYHRRSTGVNSSRLRLYPEQFLKIEVVVPPLNEQAAIVRFLDWMNGRLDRAIRAKRKELALISEMLSVVTENALRLEGTRRLRLSVVAEEMSRPIDRRANQNYTRIGLYNRGRGIFHKTTTDGAELGDSDFFWIEDGDLVISGQFAWEGAVALARGKDSGTIASHRYPVLRGRKEYVSSSVLFALFRTSFGSMLLNHNSRGAAGRNRPLNAASLLKETIPIPPKAAQARITELIDQEYAVNQSLSQFVKCINEYRTRLVADVVTGKLDLREVAAKLPEEAPAEIIENETALGDETENIKEEETV